MHGTASPLLIAVRVTLWTELDGGSEVGTERFKPAGRSVAAALAVGGGKKGATAQGQGSSPGTCECRATCWRLYTL